MSAHRPRNPLTPERLQLAESHLPLALTMARPFQTTRPGLREEYRSVAFLAVADSAGRFDPGRGRKFGAFAKGRIRGALLDAQRETLPLGYRYCGRSGPEVRPLPYDTASPDEPVGADLERVEAVAALLAALPARHAAVIRLIYFEGLSQHQVGRELDLAQSRVSELHAEALEFLRGLVSDSDTGGIS
ncbi:MAG: sigD 3 [Planctomycetota bacterium]|nr:sigD 3 [Planctomycetota bacterium]